MTATEIKEMTLEELKKKNKQLEKDLKLVANELLRRLQR